MSQAAADRQAQLDKNKAAWQQRNEGVAATAASGGAAIGDAGGAGQSSGDRLGPSQQAGDVSAAHGDLESGAAAESSASAGEASSSSSGAEEDGPGLAAKGAQVGRGVSHYFCTSCIVKRCPQPSWKNTCPNTRSFYDTASKLHRWVQVGSHACAAQTLVWTLMLMGAISKMGQQSSTKAAGNCHPHCRAPLSCSLSI